MSERTQVVRYNLTKSIASLEKQLKVCKNVNEIARLELEVKELQMQLDGAKDGLVKK